MHPPFRNCSMVTNNELHASLPADTLVPVDDGQARHLTGRMLPDLQMPATSGTAQHLPSLPYVSVLFFYPMTSPPGKNIADGRESIPGALGCTLECLSFAAIHDEITATGASVFGISTQPCHELNELRARLGLPFELMSDESGALKRALNLPTFSIGGKQYIRTLTLIIIGGRIAHDFYPVFPPHLHPAEVLAWLRSQAPESLQPVAEDEFPRQRDCR